MAKSYKKYPKVKHERLTKSDKTILNKRLRHIDIYIAYKGSQYKKQLPNRVWQYRWSWEEALQDYLSGEHLWMNEEFPTISEFRNYYERCVIRK